MDITEGTLIDHDVYGIGVVRNINNTHELPIASIGFGKYGIHKTYLLFDNNLKTITWGELYRRRLSA